jgi:hypothetical protein
MDKLVRLLVNAQHGYFFNLLCGMRSIKKKQTELVAERTKLKVVIEHLNMGQLKKGVLAD